MAFYESVTILTYTFDERKGNFGILESCREREKREWENSTFRASERAKRIARFREAAFSDFFLFLVSFHFMFWLLGSESCRRNTPWWKLMDFLILISKVYSYIYVVVLYGMEGTYTTDDTRYIASVFIYVFLHFLVFSLRGCIR